MAKWQIQPRAGFYSVNYMRPGLRGAFHCGLIRRDTDLGLVIAFVLDADAAAGDVIILPDGQVIAVLPSAPGKS